MFEITEDLYASHGKRFSNSVIDGIITYLIGSGIGYFLYYISTFLDAESLYNFYVNLSILEQFALGYI